MSHPYKDVMNDMIVTLCQTSELLKPFMEELRTDTLQAEGDGFTVMVLLHKEEEIDNE